MDIARKLLEVCPPRVPYLNESRPKYVHSLRIVASSIRIGQANSQMDGFLHVRVGEAEFTEVEKEFWSEVRGGEKSFISVPGYPGNIRHSPRPKISFSHVSNGRKP